MSDEALRDLERRVQASPEDFRASHELVRALERAGEAARAREELVRIARLGEAEAQRSLARLQAPRPDEYAAGARDGLVRPERARTSVANHRLEGRVRFLGATDSLLVFEDRHHTFAVNERTLLGLWRLTPRLGTAAVGARASFHLDHKAVDVHDARGEGTRVARFAGTPRLHAALGDEAAVVVQEAGGHHLALVRSGQESAVWETPLPFFARQIAFVPGRIALVGHAFGDMSVRVDGPAGDMLEIRDATSGAPIWSRDIPGGASLLAADALGFLVLHRNRAVHFERGTARDTVFATATPPRGASCDAHGVLVVRADGLAANDTGFELFPREGGAPTWSVQPDRSLAADHMLAGEHVWVVQARGPSSIAVSAFSRKDGQRVASFEQPFSISRETSVKLVPLDGALVAVATTAESLLLLRLEEG